MGYIRFHCSADAGRDASAKAANIAQEGGRFSEFRNFSDVATCVAADGVANLRSRPLPPEVAAIRWFRFIADCEAFLSQGWAAKATALGWSPLDLFGVDRHAPFARVDRAGLLWLLDGRSPLALTDDQAVIRTRSGARQNYCRCDYRDGETVLAWELMS